MPLERSSSHSSMDASMDVEAQSPLQKSAPCECRSCCGLRLSWRDYVIGPIELTLVVATISSLALALFSANPVFSTPEFVATGWFLLTTVAAVVVHISWNRDAKVADLSRVTDKTKKIGDEIGKTADKTNDLAQKLENQRAEFEKERTALENDKKELLTAQTELAEQLRLVKASSDALTLENKNLDAQNIALGKQVDALRAGTQLLIHQTTQFNEKNNTLKDHTGNLKVEVDKLTTADDDLLTAIRKADLTIDEDIEQLAQQISQAQNTSKENYLFFVEQLGRMDKLLVELKEEEHKVDQDEDDIRNRAERLETIKIELQKTTEALSLRQQEFEKITQAIEKAKQGLNETLQKLRETDVELDTRNHKMADLTKELEKASSRLEKITSQFAEHSETLDQLNGTIIRQKQEIDKL